MCVGGGGINLTAIYCTNFLFVYHRVFLAHLPTAKEVKHIPGVRFCKHLLVNVLTGQYVCLSDSAFISLPLPISRVVCLILILKRIKQNKIKGFFSFLFFSLFLEVH